MRISFIFIISWLNLLWWYFPAPVNAGGIEYTGDGTRGLGRGGAIMTRPDDPYVMARNPALLADLWGSQLYINTMIGMPHPCSQLTGGWGWGTMGDSVISMGAGEPPLYSGAIEGSSGGANNGSQFDLSPSVLPYDGEPYPEICYVGGAVLIPSVILTTKLSESIGVGIGFMPPELAQRSQMGGYYGILDTPNGKRPNPMRYLEPAFDDITYFGLLGAIGYRVLPWLRLGVGFQWAMVMVDVQSWSNSGSEANPAKDVRADFFGQDLFIPGFTVSIHIVPFDNLDVAVGYRWQDRMELESKIDLNTAPFSLYSAEDGAFFRYQSSADAVATDLGGEILQTRENIPGWTKGPPSIAPQLSFGIRFADRIRPRPKAYTGLILSNDPMHDPMADENWDIEFNAVYYFTSVFDNTVMYMDSEIQADLLNYSVIDGKVEKNPLGTHISGFCSKVDSTGTCLEYKQTPRDMNCKDQISLRIGSDYNPIPNLLALRIGASYESQGQDPAYIRPTWSLPYERFGIHTGATWRIDGRTDISLAYAHFFQETIKVAPNFSEGGNFPQRWAADPETGQRLSDEQLNQKYHAVPENEAYAIAAIPIYSGTYQKLTGREFGKPGSYFANAGTHQYSLDVVSIAIMRHF